MYSTLHNHTDYSNLRLIDSINTVPTLIDRAYDLGLKGVAITDHDAVSGHVKAINYYNKYIKGWDFIKENPEWENLEDKDLKFDRAFLERISKRKDFKLILGNEIYITRSDLNAETHEKGEKFYHFLLLSKNRKGHDQMRKLSSRAWGRGYYKNMTRVPTFIEDLEEIVGGDRGNLVGTTACLGGYTGNMFAMREFETIERFLSKMEGIFGRGNFYIELQPSTMPDQINYNDYMIDTYWGKYPFIFTTDSHYLKKEDSKVHRQFLQSKGGDREVDAFYSSAYLMDYEELQKYFIEAGVPQEYIEEMKNNTNDIKDMVEDYDLDHRQIVPQVEYETEMIDKEKINKIKSLFIDNNIQDYKYLDAFLKTEEEADRYFIELILEGYYDKIYSLSSSEALPIKERMQRLDYELEQIYETSIKIEQSLSDYFITMAKMIEIIWEEGDSFVGPGRGSAAGFLINYLIGITQLDPQAQMLYLPPWRFIHKDRPGLPDIDIDTESTKRLRIFNRIQDYFKSIGKDIVNVCNFGTEKSKSALRTAGRSLDFDDTYVGYLSSMIPNERGKDLTLSQCYEGDEDHAPIKSFVEEMDKNPEFWILAKSIEGLVTRIGIHAAGILITDGDPSKYNSLMKTSRGIAVSAFELEDSEQMGGLKYDMLTVQALDKIHATFNYLLDDHRIKWQGGLRKTYNKYLLPANLNYDDKEMWEKLGNGDIIDIFQFDTLVGSEAVRKIKPKNIGELAVANSIMRLMAQEGMDQPIETYVKYKNNINSWYREMSSYGLRESEIETLEPYLKPLYGVADSQEAVMMLVMDKNIADFDVSEANALRKAIAKKKADILAETKKKFYEKGNKSGTSSNLLNYVWNIQIGRQIGYSFSILHTMAYSTIALQEMNLATFYPDIYWKTACLSVNAGAINEEDYYNLVEEGIIELSDEDDVKKQTKIQYGKVASAISKFRKEIKIKLPDINTSRMGFTPDVKTNTIRYGIKGISRVGDHIIQEIILNRPYESLEDFLQKMITPDGKKIISKDKVVNLIKAGAFDDLEEGTRVEILDKFMRIIADRKNNLNLNNFLMLMRNGLVPDQYSEEMKCYNFTRYIRKFRFDGSYILDEVAQDYFLERFPEDKIELKNKKGNEVKTISEGWWDRVYNVYMDTIRAWIKSNMQTLLKKLNDALYNAEHEKYASGNILDWELEALNFFYSGHPLKGVSIPYDFDRLSEVGEEEIIGFFPIKGKRVPELKLYSLVGTVIDKNKQKSMITFSTTEGVIDVRLYKKQFTKYSHADEESGDEDFLEKGTHLMITGLKRGEIFVLKTYKKTGVKSILKIEVDWDKKVASFKQKVD